MNRLQPLTPALSRTTKETTMPRFSEMLDRKAEDIKAPPLPPVGEYLLMGKKHPEVGEIKGRDGTIYDRVTFELAIVEPLEVDPDAIAEFGKVQGMTVRKQFLFNTSPDEEIGRERTLNSIKLFLGSCGVDVESGTLQSMLADFPNTQCRAELIHRPDPNDAERFYLEVGRTYEA